jgi:hypothetical protein
MVGAHKRHFGWGGGAVAHYHRDKSTLRAKANKSLTISRRVRLRRTLGLYKTEHAAV